MWSIEYSHMAAAGMQEAGEIEQRVFHFTSLFLWFNFWWFDFTVVFFFLVVIVSVIQDLQNF